ncbi:MAG: ComEC/Rec2 family competence protein [Pseudomonadota bacterium]
MQRFPLSADRFGEILQAPLGFAIGMIVGTAWYFSIPFEPDVRVVWGLTIAVFAGGWLGLKWQAPRGVMYAWILVCGLVFGVAAGSAATLRAQHATVEKAMGPVLVEGWVTDAQPSRTGVRLVLDIHAIDGLNASETPNTVRLTHILSLNTEPGRFVRCWAVLRPPPQPVIAGDYDFARQAWFSGLGAVGYVQGRCRGGALGAPRTWTRQADLQVAKWRRRLAQHVRAAAGDRAGGFAAALASGDRSFMPQSDQEALRAAGLAHLLAISGLHMGIVGGLVFLFVWRGLALVEPIALRVSVKKPAAMTALIACAVYLIISGASVSTQRAFIMSAVLFGAVLFDRTALSLRSLSIAMIAILVLAPWSVLTPGFQMSFAATGALIATYEGWQNLQRKRGLVRRKGVSFWLKSLVVTSTVSSFATMPFAMYHFDRVAGLGIFANLFAMPIISMVSAPLAALALLLAPLGGDSLALRLFGLSLEGVLKIAHVFAGFGEARWLTLPAMPPAALGWFAAAIAIYVTDLRALPKAVSVMLICILAGVTWHLSAKARIHFAPSGELFLEHASGAVDRIELRNGPGLPPLRFIDAPISQVCEIGTPCILQSEWVTIVYADNTIVEEGLQVTSPIGTVKTRIPWSDVIQENGVTLERRRDGFVKRDKPACGHRPWRACAED